jgi:hypothetical protein
VTLRDFVAEALGHGYELAKTLQAIRDPQGVVAPFDFLQRVDDTVKRLVMLVSLDEDTLLAPSVLRSLCARTGVPPDLFGLEIEGPYDP